VANFKYIDGNNHIEFIFPYQDLLINMTAALKDQQFNSYIDLVSHLRNMSILALDKSDIERLERIDEIIIILKKYVESSLKEINDKTELFNIETVSALSYTGSELKLLCEYRLSLVIERICIAALRKTIFRDQVPEAQGGIFYNSERDIINTIRLINNVFEEHKIKPCDVIL
jgi:hypothetical protein